VTKAVHIITDTVDRTLNMKSDGQKFSILYDKAMKYDKLTGNETV
jgi:hypothetical protein